MEKTKLIVIAGPTASGKTALGVSLAKAFDGEVVSADSMQIYKGMDTGTAKPTREEMQGVPHHLIDFWPPEKPFSVAVYVALARQAIADIDSRGKCPILAGGTGLYINSVIDNIELSPVEGDPAYRQALFHRAEEEGGEVLLEELAQVDDETARRLHPKDVTRVVRALEVFHATGVPQSEHIRRSRQNPSPYDVCLIGLAFEDRQRLYDRIDRRVDTMFQKGLLEEVRQVMALGTDATAVQAIGYKELAPYFHGLLSLEEAAENLKRETRRYAKRQLSWFRRNENVRWLYVDAYESPQALLDAAEAIAASFLKK